MDCPNTEKTERKKISPENFSRVIQSSIGNASSGGDKRTIVNGFELTGPFTLTPEQGIPADHDVILMNITVPEIFEVKGVSLNSLGFIDFEITGQSKVGNHGLNIEKVNIKGLGLVKFKATCHDIHTCPECTIGDIRMGSSELSNCIFFGNLRDSMEFRNSTLHGCINLMNMEILNGAQIHFGEGLKIGGGMSFVDLNCPGARFSFAGGLFDGDFVGIKGRENGLGMMGSPNSIETLIEKVRSEGGEGS
ncbi:hypothetical protein HOA55_04655 [archaeon]|jgi:hypothetical protein|nr:hypothetical protein [archaeon]MBT6820620.1 hypothetical protein [archaeon]MBT7024970.1 hypothetical protein [archaeon]MBT7238589.1 hypothetical protein [archaeon]MBT7912428.1 hypothetical protein [Candidatus Bathyarchaeota archaeon]